MENLEMLKDETTLLVHNLSKSFGGTRALRGVDFAIKPGEIHGLLGQNGCGKSTLIKILAGYHEPDRGCNELWINGERVRLPINPGEFAQYGMSFVHQDLGLIPELSVLDNWMMKNVTLTNTMYINWSKEAKEAREALLHYGLKIDVNAKMATISSVERAMFAIVKSIVALKASIDNNGLKRGLLVLDEPTVFLPRAEVNKLFDLVRNIASEGTSVMFVSHDIDEVMELTDRFTVLRDGQNVGGGFTRDYTKEQIIEMILGKKLVKYNRDTTQANDYSNVGKIVAENVKGMIVNNVNFEIRQGEILGITGLVGSGFEEIPYLICGANEYQRGEVTLIDRTIDLKHFNPKKAVENGISLIPADRGGSGGIGLISVEENINMQVLKDFSPMRLKRRKLLSNAEKLISNFEIRPDDPQMGFSQLSGGNQQKALLAKWVQGSVKLLILHEPTQGVDVGARQQIYRHINEVAEKGTAVLCSSSDYEELSQICNRVIVLGRGKPIGELQSGNITKEEIAALCFQSGECTNQRMKKETGVQ